MAETKKCDHPPCNCTTTEKHCSTYCRDAGDEVEIACDCGHEPCTK
jgi:hypothetical protein